MTATSAVPKTVEAYIQSFPKNAQRVLQQVRRTIRKEIPGVEETISYNMPTFKLRGKYIIYMAGWKHHVGMYPLPAGTVAFRKQLSKYQSGKATAKFPLDQPLPIQLIRRIVRYRVEDVLKKLTIKRT